MKIKTSIINIEIEYLLFIVILISIFSIHFRIYMKLYFIYYLFIVFHELSHVFIAAILGKKVYQLKFSLAGACAVFNDNFEENSLKQIIINIIVYFAGPISNFLFAFFFKENQMIFEINLFLFFVNLLPIFPLDGFKILKNLLYLFKYKKIIKFNIEKFIKILQWLLLFFLFSVSILQIIKYYNPTILIFLMYIYIINKEEKEKINVGKIIKNIENKKM